MGGASSRQEGGFKNERRKCMDAGQVIGHSSLKPGWNLGFINHHSAVQPLTVI